MIVSKSGKISFDETKLNNNLLFKLASNWENVQGEIFPNGEQGYVYHPHGANLQAADLREMATFLDELNGVEYVEVKPKASNKKYYLCELGEDVAPLLRAVNAGSTDRGPTGVEIPEEHFNVLSVYLDVLGD